MSQHKPMIDIEKFHQKFDLTFEGQPRTLPQALQRFRIEFMEEELEEYKKAVAKKDLVGQLDALIDLQYVLLGTAYMQGFFNIWDEAWNRVQASNMNKIRVKSKEKSKRNSIYDVVKPNNWTPPNLEELLRG